MDYLTQPTKYSQSMVNFIVLVIIRNQNDQ